MEIPLSTILRFGICGIPELVPLEPPRRVHDFQIFEVSVMYQEVNVPSRRLSVQWNAENFEVDADGNIEVIQ